MDRIILKGLEFYAYHGALPEENRLGQRFVIDLEMQLDLREAGMQDDLNMTINYGEVYTLIKEIVTGTRYALIEALAQVIADRVLEKYPVHSVRVRVEKPQAPIPGIFEYAAVEIERQKGR